MEASEKCPLTCNDMADGQKGRPSVPTDADVRLAEEMVAFIRDCPSMFHTVATVCRELDAAGFTHLRETDAWAVEPGGRYYTVRNNSSVIAWKVGAALDAETAHFQLVAAHSDSPTFKLKATSELEGPAGYLRLDTEAYGGMIDYTWFDKPLSVAGRVLVRDGGRIESRLVSLDQSLNRP